MIASSIPRPSSVISLRAGAFSWLVGKSGVETHPCEGDNVAPTARRRALSTQDFVDRATFSKYGMVPSASPSFTTDPTGGISKISGSNNSFRLRSEVRKRFHFRDVSHSHPPTHTHSRTVLPLNSGQTFTPTME